MLEWTDLLMIFVVMLVFLILFLRIVFWGLKRILPKMVPELMNQVGDNIPNVKPKQLVGLLGLEFIRGGGMQMLMQKFASWLGIEPPPPPPGGQ
jgi:hypothetical protein